MRSIRFGVGLIAVCSFSGLGQTGSPSSSSGSSLTRPAECASAVRENASLTSRLFKRP
jgi:hypothetical protein